MAEKLILEKSLSPSSFGDQAQMKIIHFRVIDSKRKLLFSSVLKLFPSLSIVTEVKQLDSKSEKKTA